MVYVTGDMHGDIARFKDPEIKKLKKGDTLIICGDFGFIWDNSKKEKSLLKKLAEKDYTIAFVDGCHENFDILERYDVVEWNGGKARIIEPNIIHLMRGQVFTIEDKEFLPSAADIVRILSTAVTVLTGGNRNSLLILKFLRQLIIWQIIPIPLIT